jgi:hypothetical protein
VHRRSKYPLLLMALNSEGSLTFHTYCNTGLRFIESHPKDFHPRPTVGFEPATQESSDLWRATLNTAPRRRLRERDDKRR